MLLIFHPGLVDFVIHFSCINQSIRAVLLNMPFSPFIQHSKSSVKDITIASLPACLNTSDGHVLKHAVNLMYNIFCCCSVVLGYSICYL